MLDGVRDEWHRFRDDAPGRRFRNHQTRSQQQSTASRVGRVAAGLGLLAGGVVLLFIPGPGLLLIFFGLALFAGESGWLAGRLDRAEPVVRRRARWLKRRWRRLPLAGKVALVALAAAAAALAAWLAWRWFLA